MSRLIGRCTHASCEEPRERYPGSKPYRGDSILCARHTREFDAGTLYVKKPLELRIFKKAVS